MDNLNFFEISVYSFNLFSFMMGMLVSTLLGWYTAKRSMLIVILYFASLALYYALMYNNSIHLK